MRDDQGWKRYCRIGSITLAAAAAFSASAADEGPASPALDSLQAIVVKVQPLSVATLIDRKVYTVTFDAQSNFGALSDILNTIPSVDVDPDGVVSLRGDTNVLILVDGRPSAQFSGQSAGDALQSFPAKDIERIEVFTTPPAQFKADGTSGVINIVTRKRASEGLAGSAQGSAGTGYRTFDGANAGYRSGALVVSTTVAYRRDRRERTIQSDLTEPATGQTPESQSATNEKIVRSTPRLGLSADYTFDDRQSINGSVTWSERDGHRNYVEADDGDASSGSAAGSSESFSARRDLLIDLDANLGFIRKLCRPDETLAFSLTRSTSQEHRHYGYLDVSLIPPAATVANNLSLQENYATTEVGIDYALPVSKTQSLKLGYAFEHDGYRFGDLGNNVDPLTGTATVDPSVTDDFNFRQQINAAYVSDQSSGRVWTWLGGLRAEFASTDSQQLSDALHTADSYFKVYPSLNIKYSLSDESTLSLGASSRVTRPDPDSLNPYLEREYAPNFYAGNPELKPQFTKSYELGYGYAGQGLMFDLTGYYRMNRNSVTDLTESLGNGLTLTTKSNLPKDDSAGLEFSENGRIGRKLTYSVSGNFFHTQIDATALRSSGLQSTTGLNAKTKLEYGPTDLDSAQMTATRTAKILTPQGYVGGVDIVNLGYQRQLKSHLNAVATVSDLFDGQRFIRYTATPAFIEEYRRTTRGRVLFLGFVYSFGSKKDKPNFEYDQ